MLGRDRALVRSHLLSESEEPYQHRALRANGSVVPVEIRARSLPLDGRTVRVSVEDGRVTSRAAREAELELYSGGRLPMKVTV